MEERQPEVGRWKLWTESSVLFQNEAETEQLESFVADSEQLQRLLLNNYASEKRSEKRTNWNEAAQNEQLVKWTRRAIRVPLRDRGTGTKGECLRLLHWWDNKE